MTANPTVMQPNIKEFSDTVFVLLHSSYPFSQEARYLATVYHNVYRSYIVVAAFTDGLVLNSDFGEVVPMVSRDGQHTIIRQVLELTPGTKILWSSASNVSSSNGVTALIQLLEVDGDWWPETYYLAVVQVRETLYDVCFRHVSNP